VDAHVQDAAERADSATRQSVSELRSLGGARPIASVARAAAAAAAAVNTMQID